MTYRKIGVDGKAFMAGSDSNTTSLTMSIRTKVVIPTMTNKAVLLTQTTQLVLVGKLLMAVNI